MLYFFLSYARGDDDVYVRRFFDDLSKEVRNLTGDPAECKVGFLDVDAIALGSPWSMDLINALSTCRVFISLCSPAYFKRPACGKEWYVFRSRLQAYQEDTGEQVPALLPLIWTPTGEMPSLAVELQYYTDSLGDAYRREGLRQLLRLKRRAVLALVSNLAKRIVEVAAQAERLPSLGRLPIFDEVTNAFDIPAAAPAVPPPHVTNPRYVHFAVAAPARAEARAVRRELIYYGESFAEWSPFRPQLDDPLAVFARRVAEGRRFTTRVGGIDDLVELIERANDDNQVVVLLVDAWAVRLERYRRVLDESDRINSPTTAVLVTLVQTDAETMAQRTALPGEVLRVFARNSLRNDPLFQPEIATHDEFEGKLQAVLEEAQNRIYRQGRARRLPTGEPPGERPILEGPSDS